MRILSYTDSFGLLRGLSSLRKEGLSPRGLLFLALNSQGRVFLAVPDAESMQQLDHTALRVGEKLTLNWPTDESVPQRLFHFDSVHALRDDFLVVNGDRRLAYPGNAMDVATIIASFVREAGATSVLFGCTPHQPGTWLQGGPQVLTMHDSGLVEIVPVASGLLARRLHDHRLFLLTYAEIARTGQVEGFVPVYSSPFGNILLLERRVVKGRLVLSCEQGLVEVDLTMLPFVSERSRLPTACTLSDPGDVDGLDEDATERLGSQSPAVLGRLGSEAFVLTRGRPQPWGLRDLAPAQLWGAPTGELSDIQSWVEQAGHSLDLLDPVEMHEVA